MKKCPYCAEEIKDDAFYCRYCKKNLEINVQQKDFDKEKKKSRRKGILIGCAISILLPSLACYLFITYLDNQDKISAYLDRNRLSGSFPGRIVFQSYDLTDIYVMTADDKELINVYNGNDDKLLFPVMSPNGKMVAFGTAQGNDYNLIILDLISLEQGVILNTEDTNSFHTKYDWSPDSKMLVVSNPGTMTPNVESEWYIIHIDSLEKEIINLDFTYPDFDISPSWSPNGGYILFNGADVYDLENKTLFESTTTRKKFIWSPDSEKLYYRAGYGIHYRLHSVHPDGTNEEILEIEGVLGQIFDISKSNNENFILHAGHEEHPCIGLHIQNIDTPNKITITSGSCFNKKALWSPDRNWIVADDGNLNSKIIVYNVESDEIFNLTASDVVFLIGWGPN